VQPTHVLLLVRTSQVLDNVHHVFGEVYMGGDLSVLEKILTRPGETSAFRAYMGYAGWAPGQLEQEMKTGAWITRTADPALVFDTDPLNVWAEIMQSLGGCYELYAQMPADPSLN
jgi:putative transcriptional regulator